jgi:chemotaxis protein MotB
MAGKGGGGAWKVAYADFVTAMMAFFLVMWIVAQNKPVKEAVAQYFKDPFGTGSTPTGPRSPFGATEGGGLPNLKAPAKGPRSYGRGAAKSDSRGAPGNGGAPLETGIDGDSSRVGTMVLFSEDSAELDPEAQQRLKSMTQALLGKPNKIEIRGHATGRPLPEGSPFGDAWQLSYARCQATLKYLQEQGIEPQRMRLSQAGPYEPEAQPDTADWTTHNSRVEVYMLGEYVSDTKKPRKSKGARVGELGARH